MIPKYSHDHHHFSKKKRRNKFNSAILHPNGQSKVQLILKFQAVNICQFLKWRFWCSVQQRIKTFFERGLIQYYRDTGTGDARDARDAIAQHPQFLAELLNLFQPGKGRL